MESKPLAHQGDPDPFSFKECESSFSRIGPKDIGEIPPVAKVAEMNSDDKSRECSSDILSVCVTQKFPNLVPQLFSPHHVNNNNKDNRN